ncbi:MAG TPA: tetratricopeptide repeat protein [Polyangiaceae bacterium]|nr:tetratricopeptide repeat protein [Polyangiaceae bacterium]
MSSELPGLPPLPASPPAPACAPDPPARAPLGPRPPGLRGYLSELPANVAAYFIHSDPTLRRAFVPALIVSALLYLRSPLSNYIFDEQEALLANPYVNGEGLKFLDAFRRDFWGLAPDRSIGSYRPLPDLVWRLLWHVSHSPFVHHAVNVVVHALNAALIASFVFAIARRRAQGWFAGLTFVCFAVLTEAVTGVVGIADVLGGLGVLAALHALRLRLGAAACVFVALFLGLLSKESVIVGVPLLAWSSLVLSPALHPEKPRRFLRAGGVLVASALALVAYTLLRRRFFPVPEPVLPVVDESRVLRAFHAFLRWFRQPPLPHDPINNPLIDADLPHRVAGALRVYASGLVQVFFPWRLSGDYSFPSEPVPPRVVFPGSVLGGALLALPPFVGVGLWIRALVRERRERGTGTFASEPSVCFAHTVLVAVGLLWVPLAYFPHSNIPILLPTVRAERFWYLPAVGLALMLGPAAAWLLRSFPGRPAIIKLSVWLGFQAAQARLHAIDYTDDLMFWRATKNAVPRSAKAHLNYSVMVGARGDLEERLRANRRALELAPRWPMAHVYLGDTLCRLHRAAEAWPAYAKGFELGPNDPNLIGLALQCLWDEKAIPDHQDELLTMSDAHPGSWLAYLASDIVYNGKEHGGVQKKYRPRSYDGGPKEE